jgi:polar amino acid transport system substrate-binding protein
VTASGRTAQGVAKQYGFSFCASEFDEILHDDTNVIMVASRHDTHAKAVEASLSVGKHVFVEKPLALSVEELARINSVYRKHGENQLMIGFNRRFSPLTRTVLNHFVSIKSPLVVNIRINSGAIPEDHWIQDPEVGGGRIIGEACHFIDLATTLIRANPKTVYTTGTSKPNKSAKLNDNVIITMSYEGGSIANIVYTADGSKAMAKEYIEVFGGGRSAVIDDFKKSFLYSGDSGSELNKLNTQDKGQAHMITDWVSGLVKGVPCVDYDCLMTTSLASILAVESLSIGQVISIDLSVLESN